jgi:endo-1,4-beta-xylanase
MDKHLLFSLIFLFLSPSLYAQMAQGKAKFLGNILSSSQPDPDFATYWNQATPGVAGKWGSVEPTRGLMEWSGLDAMYHYAQRHGFVFKQHNFIWDQQQPPWMESLPPDQQKLEVTKWISQFGQRYPDTQLIDVVNEPLHDPPHYKSALGGDGSTGWDWVIWAFSTARQYCPRSKLLLNEYNVLSNATDLERFIAIIKILKQRNLIDGIGVQGHGLESVSDTTIRSSLNRLGSLKLPIYVSELDLNIADDDSQKRRYKSLFPILWKHPAVRGVTLWGYKQNHTWKPDTYLLRADGSEREALVWLKEYMSHRQRTRRNSHRMDGAAVFMPKPASWTWSDRWTEVKRGISLIKPHSY